MSKLLKYRTFMSQYIKINDFEWGLVSSRTEVRHYKKGEIISYQGEITKELLFLNYGLVRAYSVNQEGRDFTWKLYFADEDSTALNLYVSDYASFINQTPALNTFEVLEDCEVCVSKYSSVQFMYTVSKKWIRYGKLMAEMAYTQMQQAYFTHLTKSAKERYLQLLEESPYLEDKVPQYHIASYLGMTPQSLSRLKKELNSKK